MCLWKRSANKLIDTDLGYNLFAIHGIELQLTQSLFLIIIEMWNFLKFQFSSVNPRSLFLSQWFYFEFQQLYDQRQESKDSNIKPAMVQEVHSILYSSDTSLQWAASHFTLMHNLLYIWLSELGAA